MLSKQNDCLGNLTAFHHQGIPRWMESGQASLCAGGGEGLGDPTWLTHWHAWLPHQNSCRWSQDSTGSPPAAISWKTLLFLSAFPCTMQDSMTLGREEEGGPLSPKALASPATSDRATELCIVPLSRGLPPLRLFTTHPVFLSVCFTHHRLH